MTRIRPPAACLAFALMALPASRAPASETWHTCAGFIDSLPATIATQGVWCLRKDLATGITSGAAITIATNNVTIDCNDFKIGGLAGGNGSLANGIHAAARQNATIRNCNIRGFYHGIWLAGGAGHAVEDNRLDNNLFKGINLDGESVVRRNAVNDTGGATGGFESIAIVAAGEISDNIVSGVFASAADSYAHGIFALGNGTRVERNRVGGLLPTGAAQSVGIYVPESTAAIVGNHATALQPTPGYGILGLGADSVCADNTLAGFNVGHFGCAVDIDNLATP